MKKIGDLNKLLITQLKELYSAEQLQQETYKKFLFKIQSVELKNLIQKNLDKTSLQVQRIEDVLVRLGEPKRSIECKAMKELLDRGLLLVKNCDNIEVLEAGLITSIQCVKHFEIAEYGTLISYADLLDKKTVSEILLKTIAEEKALDKEFTKLAEETINSRAKEPAEHYA